MMQISHVLLIGILQWNKILYYVFIFEMDIKIVLNKYIIRLIKKNITLFS